MKKKYLIAMGLSLAMLMTGCSSFSEIHEMTMLDKGDKQTSSQSSDEEKDMDSEEDNEETDNKNDDNNDNDNKDDDNNQGDTARELSKAELSEFEDMFSDLKYEAFIDYGFADVTEIPWDDVVYYESENLWTPADDEKENIYLDTVGKTVDEYLGMIVYVEQSKLEEFCLTYTGTDYSNAKFPLTWLYIPECDAYFYEVTDASDPTYSVLSGIVNDTTYTVEILDPAYDYNKSRTFTFIKDGDDVKVISNIIHWEEGADNSYTFDSEIYGESIIYTYGTTAYLIANGNQRGYIYTTYSGHEMTSIDDIYFFDFNADGIKDILVVGDSNESPTITVTYSNGRYYSNWLTGLDDAINDGIDGDLTEDNLKAFLLKYGSNGSYSSYKEAYSQVAYIRDLDDYEYNYGLQDLDEDGMPELFIKKVEGSWFRIDVYSFEDDYAVRIASLAATQDTLETEEIDEYEDVTLGQIDMSLTYEELISKLDG